MTYNILDSTIKSTVANNLGTIESASVKITELLKEALKLADSVNSSAVESSKLVQEGSNAIEVASNNEVGNQQSLITVQYFLVCRCQNSFFYAE